MKNTRHESTAERVERLAHEQAKRLRAAGLGDLVADEPHLPPDEKRTLDGRMGIASSRAPMATFTKSKLTLIAGGAPVALPGPRGSAELRRAMRLTDVAPSIVNEPHRLVLGAFR